MNENLIFETERLILKPMTEDDAEGLFELLKDVHTSTCYGNKHLTDVDEAINLIHIYDFFHKRSPSVLTYANYGIFEKESGSFTGCMDVSPQWDNLSRRKLGYAMLPEFRGKGYVSEAVTGMVEFLMENIEYLDDVEISFFPWNEASLAVARKCGFWFDRTTQLSYRSGEGNLEDEEHWSLTRGDYEWRRDHGSAAA